MTMPSTASAEAVWFPGAPAQAAQTTVTIDEGSSLRAIVSAPEGADLPAPVLRELDGLTILEIPAVDLVTGPILVSLLMPVSDTLTLWTPGSEVPHGTVPPSWAPGRTVSDFNGIALGALLTTDGRSALSFGANADSSPVVIRAGIVEESAEFVVSFELVPGPTAFRIAMDDSRSEFATSITRVGHWLRKKPVTPSPADERPVFCTWYYAHQDLQQAGLLDQARVAAELGFGTVIIDDGWQTHELERGYGTAGDWTPDASKLPDPSALTTALAALDLRTIWWIGTPFVGYRSASYLESSGEILFEVPELDAAVVDIRSRSARKRIADRVVDLLTTAGGHGVKLDFLERFSGHDDRPLPSDADHAAVETAVSALLSDIVERGRQATAELMIELREPYIGPAASQFATMLRVEDCPLSPMENRIGIVDLRLADLGPAVHSDPIMWSPNDSPARVAQYLLNALFAVPQVSVDLLALSPEHSRVLRFWLEFWNRHAEILLHAPFAPIRPDLHYPVIQANGPATRIAVRYAPVAIEIPDAEWSTFYLGNADTDTRIPLHSTVGLVDLRVTDALGELTLERTGVDLGSLQQLAVPVGGLATFTRIPVQS